MSSSWMYDGFPLKRADENTQGDDYQFVIQSLDAAIRHTFGLPTGTSMTPAFSISSDGDVEILIGLSIGSSVQIDEIIDSIPESAAADEDEQLATVNGIRTFLGTYVDAYLSATDLFVEKAGSTMTGALVANGGITGTSSLDLSKANFTDTPSLASGVALQSGGYDLIQYSSGVLVGNSSVSTKLIGSGTRPTYNGGNIALVSDFEDIGSITLDYVPKIGGAFTGTVEFGNGLRTSSGVNYDMEYNSGANSFSVLAVGTDALGDVVLDSAAGIHKFTGDVQVTNHLQLDTGSGFVDILGYATSQVQIGNAAAALNALGNAARPLYNGAALALYSDIGGTYVAGAGITLSVLGGGAEEISITTNGINATMMPVGNNGEYSRLSPTGTLVWDSLDIAAGTGMAVSENASTKQVTVSIDNLGVDTAQLAADAVTAAKLADDAVVFDNIDATAPGGGFVAGSTYSLVSTDSVLAWQRGGELLGTAEEWSDDTKLVNSDDEVILGGSSGPYVLTNVSLLGDGPVPGTVRVIIVCDGTTVLTRTIAAPGYAPGAGDPLPFFRGAYFGKESMSVTIEATSPGTGCYCSYDFQRLN